MAKSGNARGNGFAIRQDGQTRRKLSWLAALTGTTALVALPGTASADCQPTGGGNYTCDGTETASQIINDDNVMVVANPGYSVDAPGTALRISGNGFQHFRGTDTSIKGSFSGLWIAAFDNAAPYPGNVLVDLSGSITGGYKGLHASNSGAGGNIVSVSGHVEGTTGYGIEMFNGNTSTVLTLNATSVTGGITGVSIFNEGIHSTTVNLTGHVIGGSDTGVSVVSGANTVHLDIFTASVTGGQFGINVEHEGRGATRILASGHVVGGSDTGIRAVTDETTTSLNVWATTVTGGRFGIFTETGGSGATNITTYGHVEGTSDTGVFADVDGESVDINVASVTGGVTGISVTNRGDGPTGITASGHVQGTAGAGISAFNDLNATDLIIDAASVTGAYGISANNLGLGGTYITASGHVAGTTGAGMTITNSSRATDIVIKAASISGETFGVYALNSGDGATRISATGLVEGGGYGIQALGQGRTTDLIIEAASATGGYFGLYAASAGSGVTRVTSSGLVVGGTAAISALSAAGNAVEVHNLAGGMLRNQSGASSDAAVFAEGGAVTLINHADIIGTLSLTGALTRFENNGVWNGAGGESAFGGAAGSELINAAAATVRGGANAAMAETTVLSGLPLFTTHGLVTLVDGAAGDVLRVADGDAAFQAGSALAVDLGGAATDLFVAGGTVDLTGATLQFNLTGPLVYGARYTVLTAEGGLNGTFDAVTGLTEATAFIGFQDGYDANNAWLEAVLYRDFAEAGLTVNQIATGQGLDTIPDSGALFLAVANLPTNAAAQFAFDQLSGEIHAAAQLALIEDARVVRHAMADRLQAGYRLDGTSDAARRGGLAFWINGFGSWGSSDSDGNAASLDRTTGGFLIGADTSAGAWRFGLLAGYSHTSFKAEDRASSGSSDNFHLGVYGGGEWDAFAFRSGAAYSWHDIDTERAVVFPGFAESLGSEYDGNTFQIFGELAYGLDAGEATRIEPFANLAHISLTRDGFSETGGLSALSGTEADMDATFSTLGLRLDHGFTLGSTKAAFRGMAGWRHAFGDINPASGHAFAGGDLFTVAGTPLAEDSAIIEAGFAFTLAPGARLGLSYTGLISDSAHDHGVKADLMVRF